MTSNSKSDVYHLLKVKIRTICKQRRIRLEEFMKTFDIHRAKKISIDQFSRALDVAGIGLTNEEVSLLIDKYRLGESKFINYRPFCDLIDKVFTVKSLEKNPMPIKTHSSTTMASISATSFPMSSLSDDERNALFTAKSRLKDAVLHRGIVLKDVFRDFDRRNGGKVTICQFLRDIFGIGSFTTQEVEALVKVYGDTTDVNYWQLHYDISPETLSTSPTSTTHSTYSLKSHTDIPIPATDALISLNEEQLGKLIKVLLDIVRRDRIRTKTFFTDFDPLRSGMMTRDQFSRCLKLCFPSFNFTESDVQLLLDKFKNIHNGQTVCYRDFCNLMDHHSGGASNAHFNHNDALTQITKETLGQSQLSCSRDIRGNELTEKEFMLLQVVIQRLGEFCTTRRVLLKPAFQDFDRIRQDRVTLDQFFRVLTVFKMNILNDTERAVLQQRYISHHGSRYINYVNFCADIENWQSMMEKRPDSSVKVAAEILSPTRVTDNTFEVASSAPTVRTVPALLQYIRHIVHRDRIRLEEFYRDYDKLRHGKISLAQFASGLTTSEFVLSSEEITALGRAYAGDSLTSPSKNQYKTTIPATILWKKFIEDVEGTNVDLLSVNSPRQRESECVDSFLSMNDENHIYEIMRTIKNTVQSSRLEITPQFDDFDKSRKGYISATKFERVLSMFNLLPNNRADVRLLFIKFREQLPTSTNNVTLSSICDVNYRAFLHALNLIDQPDAPRILPDSAAYRQSVLADSISSKREIQREISQSPLASAKPIITRISHSNDQLMLLLRELHRQIDTQRIRLKEFFTEGDKLRTGEVTVAKFDTALNRSRCVIDAADFALLHTEFASRKSPDKIDWRRFVDAVHRIPIDVGLSDVCRTSLPCKEPKANSPKKKRGNLAEEILDRIRTVVYQHRLHMKPYFQDYDRSRVNYVTKFQFAAVLNLMKLDISPDEIEILATEFAMCSGRDVSKAVNYLQFIQAINNKHD